MIIEEHIGRVIYTADSHDWRIVYDNGTFEIIPIATGSLVYSSGCNLDNLATLIVAAKAHAIENGINWSGN